jgi:hypothetical protein
MRRALARYAGSNANFVLDAGPAGHWTARRRGIHDGEAGGSEREGVPRQRRCLTNPLRRVDPGAGWSRVERNDASGEVKLNGSFGLAAGGATTILIDFDGESSFSQTGNGSYMINPVIRILSVQ